MIEIAFDLSLGSNCGWINALKNLVVNRSAASNPTNIIFSLCPVKIRVNGL